MWRALEMFGTVNVMTRLMHDDRQRLARRASRPRVPERSPIATSAPKRPKIAPLAPTVTSS